LKESVTTKMNVVSFIIKMFEKLAILFTIQKLPKKK